MARNPSTPEPLGPQVDYIKKYSTDLAGDVMDWRMGMQKKSSGGPEKSWGGGSYHADGRPAKTTEGAPGYGGSPKCGRHTLDGC